MVGGVLACGGGIPKAANPFVQNGFGAEAIQFSVATRAAGAADGTAGGAAAAAGEGGRARAGVETAVDGDGATGGGAGEIFHFISLPSIKRS